MAEFDQTPMPDEELEWELTTVLRPIPAPSGFLERVVAHSRELPQRTHARFGVRRFGLHSQFRWGIAAVLLLAVTLGGFLEHQRQRRMAGEHARDQVLLALRITTVTLQAVRNKVDRNSMN